MRKLCSQAEKEMKELQKQIEKIGEWLLHNTKHRDFLQKVSERNAMLVKLESKRQQTTNGWWDSPQRTVSMPVVINK